MDQEEFQDGLGGILGGVINWIRRDLLGLGLRINFRIRIFVKDQDYLYCEDSDFSVIY